MGVVGVNRCPTEVGGARLWCGADRAGDFLFCCFEQCVNNSYDGWAVIWRMRVVTLQCMDEMAAGEPVMISCDIQRRKYDEKQG